MISDNRINFSSMIPTVQANYNSVAEANALTTNSSLYAQTINADATSLLATSPLTNNDILGNLGDISDPKNVKGLGSIMLGGGFNNDGSNVTLLENSSSTFSNVSSFIGSSVSSITTAATNLSTSIGSTINTSPLGNIASSVTTAAKSTIMSTLKSVKPMDMILGKTSPISLVHNIINTNNTLMLKNVVTSKSKQVLSSTLNNTFNPPKCLIDNSLNKANGNGTLANRNTLNGLYNNTCGNDASSLFGNSNNPYINTAVSSSIFGSLATNGKEPLLGFLQQSINKGSLDRGAMLGGLNDVLKSTGSSVSKSSLLSGISFMNNQPGVTQDQLNKECVYNANVIDSVMYNNSDITNNTNTNIGLPNNYTPTTNGTSMYTNLLSGYASAGVDITNDNAYTCKESDLSETANNFAINNLPTDTSLNNDVSAEIITTTDSILIVSTNTDI